MKLSAGAAVVASVMVVATAGAQRPARSPAPPPDQQAVQQGLEALFKAMGAAQQQSTPAALLDHRELKALLPAEVKGFKRVGASSERTGAMGMTVSRAEASYEGGQGARVEIEYSDLGGLGGLGAFAQAAWVSADLDRETDRGFERTTRYKEYKAHEEYDQQSRSGKLEVLVGGRLMVSVRGSKMNFEDIRAVMDQIDLGKLAALKPAEPK